ncbi:methyl-accepting chemotaxis protein [Bacillus sp. 3255]|uniref:methyl-accepting chemotaxis protein n=1 Tax=Bacillus sp. 3255 TaxID=2817904 RepID=UPI0028557E68|nr:methyl-accepting chemotaxis protein [Bacillus sp. 3255]MDR6881515.1 methyl-accepting chemotaxis protein [Bacillus sp. 3255]
MQDNHVKVISATSYLLRTIIPAAIGSAVLTVLTLKMNGVDTGSQAFINSVLLIAAAGALLGAVIGFLNYRRFVAPMKLIISQMSSVAQGNLAVELASQKVGLLGPVTQSIGQLIKSWRGIVKDVNDSTTEVLEASTQLSANTQKSVGSADQISVSVQQVAKDMEQQSQTATDVIAALQEVKVLLREVCVSSTEVARKADQTADELNRGKEAIAQTASQMQSIRDNAHTTEKSVKGLYESLQHIEEMSRVISGIAYQTNLLALNASIEASRAGEQGRGFSVVAAEIRKLAEQSEDSAKRIREKLEEVQDEGKQAVDLISQEALEIEQGLATMQQSVDILAAASQDSQLVAAQIHAVNQASLSISEASADMLGRLESMGELAHHSSAASQHAAASVEHLASSLDRIHAYAGSLHTMAEKLKQGTQTFKL